MTGIDHTPRFIDGTWRAARGTDSFDAISPRPEQRIVSVPAASTEDIDAEVAAARHTIDEGERPRLTPAERADCRPAREHRHLLGQHLRFQIRAPRSVESRSRAEHGPDAVREYLMVKTISIDTGRQLPEPVTRNVPHGTGPRTR
ncbi:hypothetical protein [Streptomyces sp. NBC_00063]|uniref:hypothetical protein n=1 Tax=Streptomyces sp. NBC_00063 TaxID=2975638 RepID=UPI003D70FA71